MTAQATRAALLAGATATSLADFNRTARKLYDNFMATTGLK